MRIAGGDAHAGLFTVCRHCGGVLGIRGDGRDPSDPGHHRSWCKVRSGARKENWDSLALVHELRTEAVRILLPIAEFEYVERLASFKAALMLGLRDSFGGDPAHLRVIESDFPAPGGEPGDRNRFVVLHDTVPGGTGYLPRLADPDELRRILTRARDLITTCECQTRGKPGCHKCLYGGIGRHELPRVSRTVALELLDEILADWKLVQAPHGTITGVNLSPVVQSELERMFKVLLQRWGEGSDVRVTARPDADHAARTQFDLRFQNGPHWQIREQVNLANHHTKPDFYATRVDATGTPPLAVYLDGWAFHQDPEQIDGDTIKRASLRAAGTRVWTLTYADVKAAVAAANGGGTVAPVTPLTSSARNRAGKGIGEQLGVNHDSAGIVKLGAFEQLMALLRHPEADAWRKVATAIALSPVQGAAVVDVANVPAAVSQAAKGEPPTPSPTPADAKAATWETTGGLVVHTILDGATTPDHACTAILTLDTNQEIEHSKWADWLHLGNLLAGLGEQAVITTTRTFVPAAAAAGGPAAPAPVADSIEALLEDCFDDNARALATAVAQAGNTDLVVGFETGWPDGTVIEIAWPARKTGILPAGAETPASSNGWIVRRSTDWTVDELSAALASGTS